MDRILRHQRTSIGSILTLCLVAGFSCWYQPAKSSAADSPPAADGQPITFEQHIAPIFALKCQQCHGEQVQKSELDLRTTASLLKGGASGEVIAPHKPDESLLYEYIRDHLMPPKEIDDPEKRLTDAEIETIRNWIEIGAPVGGDPPTASADDALLTHDQILPILLLRCTVCHGRQTREGELDLRTRESMLAGGKSGPAIVPGKPQDSLLLKRIHAKEMPPLRQIVKVSIKPMESAEIERLTRWIEQGAPAGTSDEDIATTEPDPLVSDEDRQFWAFQPPQQVSPPASDDQGVFSFGAPPGSQSTERVDHTGAKVRIPIDAFVLEKLNAVGLSLSPEADLRTLIRRAYFDLHGLPPTPEEIDVVVNDSDPQAYEKLIDRLLDSPRYGERWGRYWLDAAGYSDSEGKTDQDLPRPSAYRYRDYVIRAFNADKPYDRFLLEQLAGDELCDYEHAAEITPEIYDNLVATGFLRMAPDATWSEATNYVPDRLAVIADELQVLGSAVMGLTIHCARCHSHKFDPIPHRDYYRLAAVLKPALDEHDWLIPSTTTAYRGTQELSACRYLLQVLPEELAELKAHNDPLQTQIDELEASKERGTHIARERVLQERITMLPESERDAVVMALSISLDERDEQQNTLIDKAVEQLKVDDTLNENAEYKQQVEQSDKQLTELRGKLKPTPVIRALWDQGNPSPTYILRRGEHTQPTRRVGPGVPSVLTDGRTPFDVRPPWPDAKTTGRRLAFAKWLVDPNHPLTARVMVNRIWMHHFGRGIVETPANFGQMGARPTHPELLDWLAIEFVRRDWSIKAMHRMMMIASTYRQSSHFTDEQQRLDSKNELYSRMPLRRVEAEVVRDAMLWVAGRLDETRFGAADPIDARSDGLVTVRGTENGWRRSIYVQQRRTKIPTMLESFDLPPMSPNCLQRSTSTVAPQALHLLNDAQVYELARRFAERIRHETGDEPQRWIDRAFQVALGRTPTDAERQLTNATFSQLTNQWAQSLNGRELAMEATTELWLFESDAEKVYEDDLISVWSSAAGNGARRYGLVEFDTSNLVGLEIRAARLDFGVLETHPIRQRAALVPPGIGGATWSSYQADKAAHAEPLDSLGTIDNPDGFAETGHYVASASGSQQDLQKLAARAADVGRVAFILTAVEDGSDYRSDWDDGVYGATTGKRPRLVVRFGDSDPGEVALRALTNICHALFNSAEFIYVD